MAGFTYALSDIYDFVSKGLPDAENQHHGKTQTITLKIGHKRSSLLRGFIFLKANS